MIGLLGFFGLWALARWRGWGARWLVLAAIWWAFLMVVHLPIQVENPLARVVGGDFQGWAVFGLLAVAVLGYREALRAVRRRKVQDPVAAPATGTFREAELDRYARHIILREIGGAGAEAAEGGAGVGRGGGGLGVPGPAVSGGLRGRGDRGDRR